MSGKTRARLACEAFWKAVGAGPDGQPEDAAWQWAQTRGTERAWEAAAGAAGEDLAAKLRESAGDYIRLHGAVAELAARVQASADATRPSKKTQTEDELAAALRQILEAS